MNGNLDSTKENEIRILYEPFGDGSVNQGFVKPNIKRDTGYCGKNIDYAWCKLNVEKVIIGKNCDTQIEKELISYCGKQQYRYEKQL